MFDQLSSARAFARARAVEDFDYFVRAVLGLTNVEPEWCASVQREVELRGVFTSLPTLQARCERAVQLWLCVLGLRPERVSSPSETFTWLFPELCERRTTQRAA